MTEAPPISPSRRLGWRKSAASPRRERASNVDGPSALADWMATWIAAKLGVEPASIDHRTPLTDYGLDSMVAVKLSGQIEDLLGRPVSPSIVWEHPTIEELARHLFSSEAAEMSDMDAL